MNSCAKFFIYFWSVFFLISLAVFAGLAMVVSIGGLFNIKSLFKSLTSQHKESSCKKDD